MNVRRRRRKHRRSWLLPILAAGILLLTLAAAGVALTMVNVAPRVLAGYVSRRVEGHNPLIVGTAAWLDSALLSSDWSRRGPQTGQYPQWAGAVPEQLPLTPSTATQVNSAEALRSAILTAKPGDRIQILPGVYRFAGNSIEVLKTGTVDSPITVFARNLGDVTLEFNLVEGFRVQAPYWHFENLVVQGVCPTDSDCEHAFHIVGMASGIAVRNCILRDFNAQIKINGEAGESFRTMGWSRPQL